MNMEAVQYNIDFNNMTDDQIKQWGKNIVKDNVVLVRNQNLDEVGILRVCELIGNVLKPDQFFMHPDYPGLFRVTNERRDGEKIGIFADKELDWHSNGNGRKSGKECCVALYCVRPGENSITSFCDTRQAYKDLSEEIVNILRSQRDEIVLRMKISTKEETEVLKKRIEKLEKEIKALKSKKIKKAKRS